MYRMTALAILTLGIALSQLSCSDPLGPTEPAETTGSDPAATLEPVIVSTRLHGDDAWRRDFERWRPNFFNRGNYYIWPRARDDFNGHRWLFYAIGLSIFERRGRIVSDAGTGRALRVKYPAGKYGARDSGVTFPWSLRGSYEELTLEYRVKFADNFRFTTSGKLPGLCGANDRLGCFRYTGGNKPNGDDGFSVRIVWLNDDGLMGTYVYHAGQAGEFGDIFVWRHGDGTDVHLERGVWHDLRLRVRLNDPGVANGQAEAWLDGERVSLATGLLFRDGSAAGRRITINEMYFNTFHGGRRPSDAPNQTQYAYYDDFQLVLEDRDRIAWGTSSSR